ncbi:MAG: hypothetical protein IJS15_02255 [Victivallales bacterium]|nr:hypothetical protein [Victivallales bacterium]
MGETLSEARTGPMNNAGPPWWSFSPTMGNEATVICLKCSESSFAAVLSTGDAFSGRTTP